MRHLFAAASILVAFGVSAGTILSIDNPTIRVQSGEYFMTVSGTGLGDQFVYDGPTGRTVIDVTADDGNGNVVAWVPMEIVNTPGTYSLTVTGRAGDSGPVTFRILKPGRPPLTLQVPEVLLALAKTRLGTGIKYDVFLDGGDGSGTVKCEPASGSTFPYGTSLIRCIASDLSGASASGEIQVNVWDGTPPTVTGPKSFEVPADDSRGAFVKYDVSAFDEIDGELKTTCSADSGAFFPNGRTTVTCEAIDAALNPASASFEVMVRPKDPGRLSLKLPDGLVVDAQHKYGAIVEYQVDAVGSADPDPVVECTPASGSEFPIGETRVLCTAFDDFDSRAEGTFLVTVKEGAFKMEDVAAEATSPEGATVAFRTDRDEYPQDLRCSHESGALFAMGTTTVTCEAAHRHGSFDVVVADTVAPHIAQVRTLRAGPDRGEEIAVQLEVDAIDAADAMPQCMVSAIGGGEGSITSDLAVSLRATQASASAFRLQVTCTDKSGNRSSETVPVRLEPATRHRAAGN